MSAQNLSRLEICIEILKSLEELGSSDLRCIQNKTGIDPATLAAAVYFLEKQGLIKKDYIQDTAVYCTTVRGERVTRYFSEATPQIQPEELTY
ncbi:MAG: hypothetical protein NWE93_03250 [Candidatus Bathyarchaeota archaeon]|nr:hypothetical protein [Candidatus Bathyarchaeota archaeon]